MRMHARGKFADLRGGNIQSGAAAGTAITFMCTQNTHNGSLNRVGPESEAASWCHRGGASQFPHVGLTLPGAPAVNQLAAIAYNFQEFFPECLSALLCCAKDGRAFKISSQTGSPKASPKMYLAKQLRNPLVCHAKLRKTYRPLPSVFLCLGASFLIWLESSSFYACRLGRAPHYLQ